MLVTLKPYINRFFILLIFILGTRALFAQTCIPVYKNIYTGNGNDEAADIVYTPDKGCIIIGGTTSETPGDFDGFILKLNELGDITWARKYGGSADDRFTRIKKTIDGGYIAIGITKSFGNTSGEVMIVKLSGAGNLVWSRHYGNTGTNLTAREIIQLDDGGYAFVANENDTTVSSQGVVCRLDIAGNVLWRKSFDHGNDDGFNYLIQKGNALYVTGYATLQNRDAILMKLDVSTGAIQSVKRFVYGGAYFEEVFNIHRLGDKLAFGIRAFQPGFSANGVINLFKMDDDGRITYQRQAEGTTNGGYKIGRINMITSADSGFVYTINDTTLLGFPKAVFIGPGGTSEWGHELYESTFAHTRMEALDKTGNEGFLFAGYQKSFLTNFKSRIVVFKTNPIGYTSSCNPGWIGAFTDTVRYSFADFIWSTVSSSPFSTSEAIPLIGGPIAFTTITSCQQNYCTIPDDLPEGCNSSFAMKYKTDRSYVTLDTEPTSDGYVSVGYNFLFMSTEPFVTKLKSNGEIVWSKTFTAFEHNGLFKKVFTAADGNFVVMGYDNHVLNHGSRDSTVVMKIHRETGEVIWARFFQGDAYDMAATDNGGYVMCLNMNYGFPPIYSFAIRLDGSGNILWQRMLENTLNNIVFRSITFEGSSIYMGGDFYSGNPALYVLKLDASSGNKVWGKRYSVSGRLLTMQKVSLTGDTLFLATNVANFTGPYIVRPALISLNATTGDVIRAFEISNVDFEFSAYQSFNEHKSVNALKTSDNNFVTADQTVFSNGKAITITKSTSAGQILWSRKYPNLQMHQVARIKEDNGNIIIAATKSLGISDNNRWLETLLLKTGPDGEVTAGGTGDCSSIPFGAITVPMTITVDLLVNPNMIDNNWIVGHNFTPMVRNIHTWNLLSCNVPSVCNQIALDGPISVCSNADTITYTASRNLSCSAPVNFIIDPAFVSVVSFTDTSIRVIFLQPGVTRVIAQLTSACSIIKDTSLVTISPNAVSLQLGADTALCPGNTIVLYGQPGYASYQWQNGNATDSFVVTMPGLYFLQVTDACGATKRDSVLVSGAPTVFVNAGVDRYKCNNDTIHLSGPNGFISYEWSPPYNSTPQNSQHITVNPQLDTAYYLKAELRPGCFGYDTIRINVFHSAAVELGVDTSFCFGNSIELSAGTGFTNYLWNTGATGMLLNAESAGMYSVIATSVQGCESRDTLIVKSVYPLPFVALNGESRICSGTSQILDAGSFVNYLWQDGSVDRHFTASAVGIYNVRVTDSNGCNGADTISITSILQLPSSFLPQDTTMCLYGKLQLKPLLNFTSYLWSNGSGSPTNEITQPGVYWLEVTDNNNCKGTDTINILSKQCMQVLFVPSAFTPNGDNNNDVLRAMTFGSMIKFEFTVFNRYGQIVYHTYKTNEGWDGKINGLAQNSGNYVWHCRYQFAGAAEQKESGNSILIR